MIKIEAGEHICLFGMTGTGKSFALRKIIQSHVKDNYIIFDVKQEDFNDLGTIVTNYTQFVKSILNGVSKIVVQDTNLTSNINIEKYLKFLFDKCKSFTVIVDELHLLCSKHKIAPSMKKILQVGRSKGKAFIGASQRTADIHNAVMSQCLHQISFFLKIKRDRQTMAEELNINIEDYDKLPQYHCFYLYSKDRNKTEIIKF